jgi:hypothetical protein
VEEGAFLRPRPSTEEESANNRNKKVESMTVWASSPRSAIDPGQPLQHVHDESYLVGMMPRRAPRLIFADRRFPPLPPARAISTMRCVGVARIATFVLSTLLATAIVVLLALLSKTMAGEPQADGYYPRLNAAMIATGSYDGRIVSVVGRFHPTGGGGGGAAIETADGGKIYLNMEHAELSEELLAAASAKAVYVEAVGQVETQQQVAVRDCFACVSTHGDSLYGPRDISRQNK